MARPSRRTVKLRKMKLVHQVSAMFPDHMERLHSLGLMASSHGLDPFMNSLSNEMEKAISGASKMALGVDVGDIVLRHEDGEDALLEAMSALDANEQFIGVITSILAERIARSAALRSRVDAIRSSLEDEIHTAPVYTVMVIEELERLGVDRSKWRGMGRARLARVAAAFLSEDARSDGKIFVGEEGEIIETIAVMEDRSGLFEKPDYDDLEPFPNGSRDSIVHSDSDVDDVNLASIEDGPGTPYRHIETGGIDDGELSHGEISSVPVSVVATPAAGHVAEGEASLDPSSSLSPPTPNAPMISPVDDHASMASGEDISEAGDGLVTTAGNLVEADVSVVDPGSGIVVPGSAVAKPVSATPSAPDAPALFADPAVKPKPQAKSRDDFRSADGSLLPRFWTHVDLPGDVYRFNKRRIDDDATVDVARMKLPAYEHLTDFVNGPERKLVQAAIDSRDVEKMRNVIVEWAAGRKVELNEDGIRAYLFLCHGHRRLEIIDDMYGVGYFHGVVMPDPGGAGAVRQLERLGIDEAAMPAKIRSLPVPAPR